MAWTQDSAGVWTLAAAAVRQAVTFSPQPGQAAIQFFMRRPDHTVNLLVFASPDGRSGYEVVQDATNISIRRISLGTPAAAVVGPTAHGLPMARPFYLEVRITGSTISVHLNGNTTAFMSYSVPDTDQFLTFNSFGFASSDVGAKVLAVRTAALIQQLAPRTDLLVAVANGSVYYKTPSDEWTVVSAGGVGALATSGLVSMTEHAGKVYFVDGTNICIFDPVALTVTDYVSSAGTMPGGGPTVDGATEATIVISHLDRLWFLGFRSDPQNGYVTAIGDPLDLDTGSLEPGAALAFNLAKQARIGQPIIAACVATKTRLIIGCMGSIWEIVGDPSLGAVDARPLTTTSGVTGKDSLFMVDEGRVVAHTAEGLAVCPETGGYRPLTRAFLNDVVDVSPVHLSDFAIHLCRDPGRHGLMLFITPVEPGPAVHLWYDEKGGQYSSRNGGFWPDVYAERIGPTCSCIWLGQLVLGGRDGYLYQFVEPSASAAERVTADDGEAFEARCPLSLVVDPNPSNDTQINGGRILLGDGGSDVTCRIWGGMTAEEAYIGADRWKLMGRTIGGRTVPFSNVLRSPAMVMELSSASLTARWEIEAVAIESHPMPLTPRVRNFTPEAEPAPSPPFVPGGGPGPGGTAAELVYDPIVGEAVGAGALGGGIFEGDINK